MFTYQKTGRYFAQSAEHMEELGAKEIEELGAYDVKPVFRGIYFSADKATLYKINYLSRICTRILVPLITFDCHSNEYLYKTAQNIDWSELFSIEQTFCVSANVSNSIVSHSQYASLKLKDAIVDQFRERFGERPNVERINPDIHFNIHIDKNRATIYLDASGGSLHRRGYRKDSQEAPMQENLAAAVIALSGWDGQTPVYDPMCGSGTLLFEAAMRYCKIPSGYLRNGFGFKYLPDYDPAVWGKAREEADSQIIQLPEHLISGSDISFEAVKAAKANASSMPQFGNVRLSKTRFQDIGTLEGYTILTNPPYGKRMGRSEDVSSLVREFGDFLKRSCKGSNAFIYFGNRELIKSIGLRSKWKKPLKNGALDGRLVKYELY